MNEKKVLIISDDFDDLWDEDFKKKIDNGIYYYNKEDNYLTFNAELVINFKDADLTKDYDFVLIDYGIQGGRLRSDYEANVEVIKALHKKGVKFAWCGGLDEHYYNNDCQHLFPQLTFLHDLRCCGIGSDDIKSLLYDLDKNRKPVYKKEKIKLGSISIPIVLERNILRLSTGILEGKIGDKNIIISLCTSSNNFIITLDEQQYVIDTEVLIRKIKKLADKKSETFIKNE